MVLTKPAVLHHFSLPLRFAAVALFALALWVGWMLYRRTTANEGAAIQSIAVLPFVNVGNDAQMEYFSDGITESLMQSLQQTPGLRVMARGTVFSYKGRDVDPRQLGEALQVQAVINGRVEKRDEQLSVWIELADARNGSRLWSNQYQRQMKDLAAIQGDLKQTVSDQLAQRFGAAQPPRAAQTPAQNAEAYRLYLLGNYYANKQSLDNELKALDYYQQTLAIEPNHALAYAGIAAIYTYLSSRFLSPQEAMPKARAAAQKAIELNSSLAEAHHSLALVKWWGDWDWQEAEQEFKRALALNPNLAVTHTLYANTLSFQRRFAEFHYEIALARQLDPLSPLAIEVNIWGLYFERRYDEVLAECQKLQSLDPNYSRVYVYLSLAYRQKGQLREALTAAQQGLAIQQSDHLVSVLAYLYAVSGQPESARRLLTELEQNNRQRQVSPFNLARIHVGLGEYDRAFTRLQDTYVQHSEFLFSLPVDPIYDPLRADPRYAELVRNIGLPP